MLPLSVVIAALLPATLLAAPNTPQESLAKRDYWGDAWYFHPRRFNRAMRRNGRYAARAARNGWNIAPPYGFFNKRSTDSMEELTLAKPTEQKTKGNADKISDSSIKAKPISIKASTSAADSFFGTTDSKSSSPFDFGPVEPKTKSFIPKKDTNRKTVIKTSDKDAQLNKQIQAMIDEMEKEEKLRAKQMPKAGRGTKDVPA